jgi:hypothetical protein
MNQNDNNIPPNEEDIARLFSEILKGPSSDQEDLLTAEKIEDIRQDRRLRKSYANKWFWVLLGQLIIVNVIFGYLIITRQADNWTFRIYISATLLETFGVIYFITQSLFPRGKSK